MPKLPPDFLLWEAAKPSVSADIGHSLIAILMDAKAGESRGVSKYAMFTLHGKQVWQARKLKPQNDLARYFLFWSCGVTQVFLGQHPLFSSVH